MKKFPKEVNVAETAIPRWAETKNRHPLPPISYGKHAKAIMLYVLNKKNNLLELNNKRRIYLALGIPKASFQDTLKRLINNKLIQYKEFNYNLEVTNNGKLWLESMGGNHRGGWRSACEFSEHKIEFKTFVSDGTKITKEKLNNMQPLKIHSYNLSKNNIVHNLYYDNETIVIYNKCIMIKIHELIGNPTDTQLEAFQIALKYIDLLNSANIKVQDRLELTDAHYELVKNELSGILNEFEHNMRLDLGQNRFLWIDHSKSKKNKDGMQGIESNDPIVISKIKDLLADVSNSELSYKDITKLCVLNRQDIDKLIQLEIIKSGLNNQEQPKEIKIPDYIY